MFGDRVIRLAFLISLCGHLAFLGMPGFDVSSSKSDEPEDILIRIVVEKPPLLPDIDVMGKEKKLKSDHGPETTDHRLQTTDNKPRITAHRLEDLGLEPKPCSLKSDIVEVVDPAREATLRYQDMVKQRIEEVRRYPPFARKHGIEGSACLGFVVSPDGSSRDIRLICSSGSRLLDREAIATIRRAGQFPPVPEEIGSSFVQMELSIVFTLK